MINKTIFPLFVSIFFSLIIGTLVYKQIIYPTIIPMVIKGGASIFSDWTVILNASDCYQKGHDVYIKNPCDFWDRKHVYGEILLKIPYLKIFSKFYYFYFPIIMSFLFLFSASYCLFQLENIRQFILLTILVFSIPVILVIERSNIDMIIFISMILLSKYNNYFLKYLLIIFSSITKFYPILLSLIFLFEKNKKNLFLNLFFVLSIFFILIGTQYENIIKIFDNKGQFIGYGYGLYEFSFIGFLKFLTTLNIVFEGVSYNWIKYIFVIIFILIPLIFFNLSYNLTIKQTFNKFNVDDANFEDRLYFLSSTIIIFCYFFFSNFLYREIFFLGLLPLILLSRRTEGNRILSFYYYLIIAKFLLTTLFVYFYQNYDSSMLKPLMIFFKHTLDFYLIFLVLRLYTNIIILFFRKIFLKISI